MPGMNLPRWLRRWQKPLPWELVQPTPIVGQRKGAYVCVRYDVRRTWWGFGRVVERQEWRWVGEPDRELYPE